MATGFGDEDDYNLYEKPLFTDRTAASIYKNVNRETGTGNLAQNLSDDGEEDEVKDVLRQQPNRGFEGTKEQEKEKRAQRQKPVEFEKGMLAEDVSFSKGTADVNGLQGLPVKRARLN